MHFSAKVNAMAGFIITAQEFHSCGAVRNALSLVNEVATDEIGEEKVPKC